MLLTPDINTMPVSAAWNAVYLIGEAVLGALMVRVMLLASYRQEGA